jgi:hypothetical protein
VRYVAELPSDSVHHARTVKYLNQIIPALILVAVSTGAAADCAFPKAPERIPEGKSASENEMLEATAAFKQYNGDVNSYTTCLDKETTDKVREAGGATSIVLQIKALQAKKHNAAVEELQDKAKSFNEQVRVFKSRKSA